MKNKTLFPNSIISWGYISSFVVLFTGFGVACRSATLGVKQGLVGYFSSDKYGTKYHTAVTHYITRTTRLHYFHVLCMAHQLMKTFCWGPVSFSPFEILLSTWVSWKKIKNIDTDIFVPRVPCFPIQYSVNISTIVFIPISCHSVSKIVLVFLACQYIRQIRLRAIDSLKCKIKNDE